MQQKHEFSPGDTVEWIRAPFNVQRGLYEVVRQMPEGHDGELQYRIKSKSELTERVVSETQICSRPSTGIQSRRETMFSAFDGKR